MNLKQLYEERARLGRTLEELENTCKKEGRILNNEEEKRYDKALDELKIMNDQIKRFEQGRNERALTQITNDFEVKKEADEELVEALREASRGIEQTRSFDGRLLTGSEKRSLMTSGDSSFGKGLNITVNPRIYEQAIANTAWLQEITSVPLQPGTTYFPYLDRDNRVSAQNKAETGQLSEQGYVIDRIAISWKGYFGYLVWANNVERDAATQSGGFNQFIMNAAMTDIRQSIASDILYSAGSSNDITGLASYSGVLSVDGTGSAITKDLILDARKSLAQKNCNLNNLTVLMSPSSDRIWNGLENTVNDALTFPDVIRSMRYYTSSLVSDTESTDKTKVFIGDFSKINLYVENQYTIKSDQRKIDYDQSVMLVVMRVDCQLYEPDHLCIIDTLNTV